jgi:hypothetical protein
MNWTVRIIIIAGILLGMIGLWWGMADQGGDAQLAVSVHESPESLSDGPTAEQPLEAGDHNPGVASPTAAADQSAPDTGKASHDLLANRVLIPPPEDLNDSDAAFLAVVASVNEELPPLLSAHEQIRKWVLLVNLAADGKTSLEHRPFKLPYRKFLVVEKGDRVFLNPANYDRYSALVETVTQIPPQTLVSYFRFWQPLLERAYNDIGEPAAFDSRVEAALEQVLAAPVLEGEIELEPPTSVMYRYKSKEHEQASAIHKWLWRTGPDNMRKLQAYFREVQAYLKQSR